MIPACPFCGASLIVLVDRHQVACSNVNCQPAALPRSERQNWILDIAVLDELVGKAGCSSLD